MTITVFSVIKIKSLSYIKVDAVRGFGGEPLLFGANFDEAKAKAIALARERNMTFVPPFDHSAVIAGQGTLAMELLQQDAHLDRIFVPVGGGGRCELVSRWICHGSVCSPKAWRYGASAMKPSACAATISMMWSPWTAPLSARR